MKIVPQKNSLTVSFDVTGVEFNCSPGETDDYSDVTLESKCIISIGLSLGMKKVNKVAALSSNLEV